MTNTREVSLIEIAKVFLTIGTIGFGGGVAILALMQNFCVEKRKWLTIEEFSHGVALGQFLGPFAVNSAIFVGYKARKSLGAIVAMCAFLTPSIILVIVLCWFYQHYNKLPAMQSALKGITPVVIALILSATLQMSKNRFKSAEPIIVALVAVGMSTIFNLPATIILLCALVYGFAKAGLSYNLIGGDKNND